LKTNGGVNLGRRIYVRSPFQQYSLSEGDAVFVVTGGPGGSDVTPRELPHDVVRSLAEKCDGGRTVTGYEIMQELYGR